MSFKFHACANMNRCTSSRTHGHTESELTEISLRIAFAPSWAVHSNLGCGNVDKLRLDGGGGAGKGKSMHVKNER
jgi:hypothetical protein